MFKAISRRKAVKLDIAPLLQADEVEKRYERDKQNIREKFDASFFGGLSKEVAFELIFLFNRVQMAFQHQASGYQPQP